MLINSILGNLHHDSTWANFQIVHVDFEWYELDKKIIRKTTTAQQDIGIQLTKQSHSLNDGDVLAQQDNVIIVVRVLPTQAIAIMPRNYHELAKICYEIGNRHAPLFFAPEDDNTLLVAYDEPMLQLLQKMHIATKVVVAQLIQRIGSAAHQHHDH